MNVRFDNAHIDIQKFICQNTYNKLTKELRITEKALREDYSANIKNLGETFKKEM